MAISRPCYASREDVKRALDVKETARSDGQVDRAIEAASDAIDGGTSRIGGLLKRRFYPELRTMTFDWPNFSYARPWRLWLDQHELISVTSLTAGGVTIPAEDYFLRPDDGPPFTHVELDLDSNAAFGGGTTPQRDISITGLYGYNDDEATAGALAAAVDDSTSTVSVTDSSAVGVGNVIRVGTERMLVTNRSMADTGQDLAADLAQANNATGVTVADGTAFGVDEVILVDAERMLIVDIADDVLVVRRGWDGSTLAAHSSGADVFASRTLTVLRGALGTVGATHADGAAVARHTPPSLVRDLCVAFALTQFEQETAAYARTVGSGDNARSASGAGLMGICDAAYTAYGRKARTRAV